MPSRTADVSGGPGQVGRLSRSKSRGTADARDPPERAHAHADPRRVVRLTGGRLSGARPRVWSGLRADFRDRVGRASLCRLGPVWPATSWRSVRSSAAGSSRARPCRGGCCFLNAFVETSVPSILILLGSRQVDPVYPLQSAATSLYAVFIVLSTLRLDFRLSVFTGCVAAVEYVLLSFALVGRSEVAAGTLFSLPPFHLAKGVTLVLAGLAAGFVADQIKRRVMRVFLALEERQRIVSAFGQQVSPAIVEELLKQGPEIPSKRTFVCVLFMDVRGFHATRGEEDARGVRRVSECRVRRGDRDRGPQPRRDQPVRGRRLHGDFRRTRGHRPRLAKRLEAPRASFSRR